jgi:hypothetical protein
MSTLTDPQSFTAFLASRGRAYVVSSDELGKFQSGFRNHGCNCYASGEELNSECIMAHAWPDMLAWLDMLYKDPDYAEQVMVRAEDMDEETRQALENMAVTDDGDVKAEDAAQTGEATPMVPEQAGPLKQEASQPCVREGHMPETDENNRFETEVTSMI